MSEVSLGSYCLPSQSDSKFRNILIRREKKTYLSFRVLFFFHWNSSSDERRSVFSLLVTLDALGWPPPPAPLEEALPPPDVPEAAVPPDAPLAALPPDPMLPAAEAPPLPPDAPLPLLLVKVVPSPSAPPPPAVEPSP